MILKPKNAVSVRVDGNRINVAGRRYESAHIMITGASTLQMIVSPDHVVVDATFNEIPEIHDSTPHILRVSAPGSNLELDIEGAGIREIKEEDNNKLLVKSDLFTFKFESSEGGDSVVLKIPKIGPVKVKEARILFNSPSSVNAIIEPFIVGIVSVTPKDAVGIHLDRVTGRIEITA